MAFGVSGGGDAAIAGPRGGPREAQLGGLTGVGDGEGLGESEGVGAALGGVGEGVGGEQEAGAGVAAGLAGGVLEGRDRGGRITGGAERLDPQLEHARLEAAGAGLEGGEPLGGAAGVALAEAHAGVEDAEREVVGGAGEGLGDLFGEAELADRGLEGPELGGVEGALAQLGEALGDEGWIGGAALEAPLVAGGGGRGPKPELPRSGRRDMPRRPG
jgi:hypothetical protein